MRLAIAMTMALALLLPARADELAIKPSKYRSKRRSTGSPPR